MALVNAPGGLGAGVVGDRGSGDVGKGELGHAALGILERPWRFAAEKRMRRAERDEDPVVGAPVTGGPAAAPGGTREPAEKAAGEPDSDLVAALRAPPLEDAEGRRRGRLRQGPSPRQRNSWPVRRR